MKIDITWLLVGSLLHALVQVGASLKLQSIEQNASSKEQISQPSIGALVNQQQHDLVAGDLVFDFGFYNGADTNAYCSHGLRVVAVEADPSLVQIATQDPTFATWIQSKQLTLLNYAIAPAEQTEASWTKFYLNKCTKEWNSFYSGVGCRTCTPPHPEDPSACVVQTVQSTPCLQVFQTYGTPKYFKLDIEGAESGCYEALETLPVTSRPLLISGEVGNDQLIDKLSSLGYKSFKLVQQTSGHSGVWGTWAQDCRTGGQWRSLQGARAELQGIFKKAPVAGDICPGIAVGGVWYDVHASQGPHQTY
jgi:hypothetical protein